MLGDVEPNVNIEDVHRDVLDELLDGSFSREERRVISARWHELSRQRHEPFGTVGWTGHSTG